jgi:hypothetical protein
MDLRKTLNDLYMERAKLDRVIAFLESLAEGTPRPATTGSRRGRRFMNPQERLIVSERMRKYWARRRAVKEQAKVAAASAA